MTLQTVTIPGLQSNNDIVRTDDLIVAHRAGNSVGQQDIYIPLGQLITLLSNTFNLNNAALLAAVNQVLAALPNYVPLTAIGAVNGVAPLGPDQKIPAQYLNVAGLNIQGEWDATSNTPALIDGTGVAGDFYVVINGVNRDLGSGAIDWDTDAWIIYDGTKYIQNRNNAPLPTFDTSDVDPVGDRQYVTADQLAALVGTTGTPSATNKFVTDSDPRLGGGGPVFITGDGRFGPHLFMDDTILVAPDDGQMHLLVSLGWNNAQAAAKWPKTNAFWAGGINVNTATYGDCVLQEMYLSMNDGWSTCHFGDRSFWRLTLPDGKITLPTYKTNGTFRSTFKSNQFNSNFNGASFLNASGLANTTILHRMPANHNQAAGGGGELPWIESSFEFNNGVFIGGNLAGQKGIVLGATYTSVFNKLHMYDHARALDLRFALNATINGFHAAGNSEYAIYQDIGAYTGIPSAADSVSQVVVNGSRVQIPDGATGAMYFRGGDGCKVNDSVVELGGGGPSVCTHGIKFDNAGNTVCKDFKVYNVHFEGTGTFSEALVHARAQADCTILIDGVWPQAPGNHLVYFDNAAGSNTCKISNTPNTSGATWKLRYRYVGSTPGSAGGGGGFVFDTSMLPGNPASAAAIQSNAAIWDLTNFSSPITGSNRIILRERPL